MRGSCNRASTAEEWFDFSPLHSESGSTVPREHLQKVLDTEREFVLGGARVAAPGRPLAFRAARVCSVKRKRPERMRPPWVLRWAPSWAAKCPAPAPVPRWAAPAR